MERRKKYEDLVRPVDDFPKPGVRFYDLGPALADGEAFSEIITDMAEPLRGKVNKLVGFDARGFLFAGAMASKLEVGCTLLRKPGKLPGETESVSYDLEYGSNSLEMQTGLLGEDDEVALVDDVIATGGTALAGIDLVRRSGARIVEMCSVVDLPGLGGSEKIRQSGVPVRALLAIGGDDETL